MKKLCHALCLAYLITLSVILGLDQTSRSDFPLLALITTFSVFLFAPLILIGMYAVWQRSWISSGVLFAGLILFLVTHPIFPQKSLFVRSQDATHLEIMTFNIEWNVVGESDIAMLLSQQEADFIGTQEVAPSQIRRFDLELRNQYPYQTFDPGNSGVGLLSKYPITNEVWMQPPTEGRPILHAELDIDGQLLNVFVAHISWPTILTETTYGIPKGMHEYWQAREIYFLQQQAKTVDGPVVVMGDFNMSDQSHSYKELSADFGDAFRDGGWGFGFTFPNYRNVRGQELKTPLLRIDYIFYDEVFQIKQANVKCFEGGSDHCAMQASLAFP